LLDKEYAHISKSKGILCYWKGEEKPSWCTRKEKRAGKCDCTKNNDKKYRTELRTANKMYAKQAKKNTYITANNVFFEVGYVLVRVFSYCQ
jgi:hypothetical protein